MSSLQAIFKMGEDSRLDAYNAYTTKAVIARDQAAIEALLKHLLSVEARDPIGQFLIGPAVVHLCDSIENRSGTISDEQLMDLDEIDTLSARMVELLRPVAGEFTEAVGAVCSLSFRLILIISVFVCIAPPCFLFTRFGKA